jgi:nucleoside-diphosphate-sugar epimerase
MQSVVVPQPLSFASVIAMARLELHGSTCVVTGAAGFFGPYLVRALLRDGVAAVRAIDLQMPEGGELSKACSSSKGRAVFVRADLCGPKAALAQILTGAARRRRRRGHRYCLTERQMHRVAT